MATKEQAMQEMARRELAKRKSQIKPAVPDYSEVFKADDKNLSNLYGFKRPIGLHARSSLQGLGSMADFIGTPIRLGVQAAGMDDPSGGGKRLADYLNLPKPENPTERVTSGINEIIAGGAGLGTIAKAGSLAANAGSTTSNVLKTMASGRGMQLSSAVGAGTAGGLAKESGAGPVAQVIASVIGGVGTPLSIEGGKRALNAGKAVYQKLAKDPKVLAKIDLILESAAKQQGIKFGDIAANVKNQLHKDMKESLKRGEMSPDVVRRLIDYRTTGLTPTAGSLTLDPGIVTKQKNLAKLGANSKDPRLERLSKIEGENNTKLIENINKLGADKAGSNAATGQKIIDTLDDQASTASKKIDLLYKNARGTEGRSAKLDPSHFTQKANNLLDEAMIGGKLPADVRNNLNKIAKGETPLTVDVAEQFKTNIAALQRATIDKAEKMALGAVREALDDTPMLAGQNLGKDAIKAFNKARTANREWMKNVENIPALKAVVDGVEPDKFVQTYITGAGKDASINNVRKLKNAMKNNPEAISAVKDNIAQFLKSKALSGAADEVGSFSQSGFNKALTSIGNDKLKIFFSGPEYRALKAIGRVASYEQVQPRGSAVNNSNTASTAIAAVLDRIGGSPLLRKIPLGAEIVSNPIKSVSMGIQANKMAQLPTAAAAAKQPLSRGLVVPGAAILSSQGAE